LESGELINIGQITGTYGYAGMVKVVPLTNFPGRFKNLERIKINKQGQIFELYVESVKPYKKFYLFKFKGIESKETAREYQNAFLQIDESELYPLPDGYFYHFQLEGLAVYDIKRGFLGELKEVLETGANDVYIIESGRYGEILIPAIRNVIIDVDLEKKKMQVKLLPGLIKGEV